MESVVAGIVGIILLAPLIGLNVLVSIGKSFSEKVGPLVGRLVKEEVALSPQQEHRFKRLDRLFQFVWLVVGAAAAVFLLARAGPSGALAVIGTIGGAVGIFIAFKSGAMLTRFVAYAFHDRAVVREKAGQIPLGGLISKAIVPGIAANAVFLLVWALLFRVANVAVKGIGEAGANWLPIGLWLGGLVFGYVYGIWRSGEDPRFLLRDDFGVVAFMGIMKADKERQKAERSIARLKEKVPMPPPTEAAKKVTQLAEEVKEKAVREAGEKLAEEAKRKARRFRPPGMKM